MQLIGRVVFGEGKFGKLNYNYTSLENPYIVGRYWENRGYDTAEVFIQDLDYFKEYDSYYESSPEYLEKNMGAGI